MQIGIDDNLAFILLMVIILAVVFLIERRLPRSGCQHEVVDGFGGMGDSLVCVHCGKDKYPEAFGWYKRRLPNTEVNMVRARQARDARKAREREESGDAHNWDNI